MKRYALIIGAALGLMLSSRDHDRDAADEARYGRRWTDLGTGAWDARGRPSEVRLNRQAQVARGRDHPRGDHRRLARHDRHECVEVRQQKDDQVRPARGMRHQVGELAEDRGLP